eukprot:gene9122-11178_t
MIRLLLVFHYVLSDDPSVTITRKRIVRIILESAIQDITFNINAILKRQDEANYKARVQAAKIGVGVTTEAQEIFNSLSKTLPCEWSGKTIVVLSDVKITSPYNVENCTGTNIPSLERVRKVLEGERKKLKLKE